MVAKFSIFVRMDIWQRIDQSLLALYQKAIRDTESIRLVWRKNPLLGTRGSPKKLIRV